MSETEEPTHTSSPGSPRAWLLVGPLLLSLAVMGVIVAEVTPRTPQSSSRPVVSASAAPSSPPVVRAQRLVLPGAQLSKRRIQGASGGPQGLVLSSKVSALRLGPLEPSQAGWGLVLSTDASAAGLVTVLQAGHPLGSLPVAAGPQLGSLELAAGAAPDTLQLTATPGLQLRGLALWPLGDRIELDFGRPEADLFAVSGLYPGEGRPERRAAWSRGQRTHFRVPLAPGKGEYQLRLVAHAHEALSPLTVTVHVNDVPVGSFTIRQTWTAPRVVVPANLLKRGLADVTLEYGEVVQPSQVFSGTSTDDRLLALLIDRLWLEPRS